MKKSIKSDIKGKFSNDISQQQLKQQEDDEEIEESIVVEEI